MKPQNILKTTTFALLTLVATHGVYQPSLTVAETPVARLAQAASKPDIDRQLLENLGAEPVDDLDRELFAPKKKPTDAQSAKSGKTTTNRPPGAERPGDQIVRDLLQELRQADAAQRAAQRADELATTKKQPTNANDTKPVPHSESATPAEAQGNPLISIARQMRIVEHRIEQTDSGPATQRTQQQIIDQLERLIEQAKKSCCGGKPGQKQCQGGTCDRKKVTQSKKPSKCGKPGKSTSPSESTGSAAVKEPAPSGRTDMEQMQTLLKRLWGELPDRDREQMLQYPVEQFLPEYEQMIEEYYKRLSEAKDDY